MADADDLPVVRQQTVAPGGKATNIIMQNQQAVMQEYLTEPYIPDEVQAIRPIESMMIMKRSIGNETDLDIAMNDIEYDMVALIRQIAGEETALDVALSYVHHREGLRAKGMSERMAQVTQRTYEELTTHNAAQKRGFFDRIGGFVRGSKPQPGPFGGQQQ
jgi:hypothetical protein